MNCMVILHRKIMMLMILKFRVSMQKHENLLGEICSTTLTLNLADENGALFQKCQAYRRVLFHNQNQKLDLSREINIIGK